MLTYQVLRSRERNAGMKLGARGMSRKLWCVAAALCLASWAGPAMAQCVDNSDCTSPVDCAQPQCVAGTCVLNLLHGVCDNSLYCDGAETCDPVNGDPENQGCLDGPPPCPPPSACDEAGDFCYTCLSNSDCDDGAYCNGAETCVNYGCVAGTPFDCDDGFTCTIDSCNDTTGTCDNTPDNAGCDDTIWCNGDEVCDPANGAADMYGCVAAGPRCVDGLNCTYDHCVEYSQQCYFYVDCFGGVACTIGACGADGECEYTNNDAYCDDGDFCNGAQVCDPPNGGADGCTVAVPEDCDDGQYCTVDSCDSVAGACVNTPNNANCDDFNPCTDNICTASGCIFVPNHGLCDNNVFCDGVEVCDPVLGCIDGPDPSCDDGVGCTGDICNVFYDACEYTPSDIWCNDSATCSTEVCDPVFGEIGSGCLRTFDDSACDDGLWCTGVDTCDPANSAIASGCVISLIPCIDGVDCTDDDCDEATQTCDNPNNCDDLIDCTTDLCHYASNACIYSLNHTMCDDGEFCNGAETCDPVNGAPMSGCLAGTPVDCDDGATCSTDICNEINDTCLNIVDHLMCDDGYFCTGAELCDPPNGAVGTGCTDGADPTCDDGLSCTMDSCDPVSDSCVNTDDCTGGVACAIGTCEASGCTYTSDHTLCDDGLDCTLDLCNLSSGCGSFVSDEYCMNLNTDFCDGTESCDPVFGCVSSGNPCAAGTNCDEVTDTCAQCSVDSDCSGVVARPFCCGNQCKGCCDDSDCGLFAICDPIRGFCLFNTGGIE